MTGEFVSTALPAPNPDMDLISRAVSIARLEWKHLRSCYPSSRPLGWQQIIHDDGRYYDRWTLTGEITAYFDVTDWQHLPNVENRRALH